MSKVVAKEIKLKTLSLYRNILKMHYMKLNEEMRVFGDYFVKSEFTLNYRQADEAQLKIFFNHWVNYLESMKKMKDLKNEIKTDGLESLKTKMDIDQKKSLDDIKNLIDNKV